MNGFYNPQYNVDKINRQIEELTNMRQQIQQSQIQPMQQAPINNIINTNPSKVELEAKILGENQKLEDVIIQNRTLFIDETNKKISIKELDGTISKEYEIIIPKTKEEIEIEELKRNNTLLQSKLNDMEVLINEYAKSNKSDKQVIKSDVFSNGNDESTTKKSTK